jgi:hypothetical protein
VFTFCDTTHKHKGTGRRRPCDVTPQLQLRKARLLHWRYSAENKSWIRSLPQIRGSMSNFFEAQSAAAATPRHALTAS